MNQNHDGLDMKATFPLAKLNQIHGSWFDARNPVVAMDGAMRDDLDERLDEWAEKADLVLALGTTLSGLRADMLAERVAARARGVVDLHRARVTGAAADGGGSSDGGYMGGLVIVALTKTPLDDAASLRIYGRLDEVLGRLAARLRLPLPTDAEVAKASKRSARVARVCAMVLRRARQARRRRRRQRRRAAARERIRDNATRAAIEPEPGRPSPEGACRSDCALVRSCRGTVAYIGS